MRIYIIHFLKHKHLYMQTFIYKHESFAQNNLCFFHISFSFSSFSFSAFSDAPPVMLYSFIEQTLQPGPAVSLKCSAAGNPTPQVTWTLDGFPLPSNGRYVSEEYDNQRIKML